MIAFDKFAKGFVIISIVILGLIAGFNYWIDPAGIFNNRKVDLAISYLVDGKCSTFVSNFNERLLKKELILQTKEKPETIVLGSSRTMGIRAEFDKDKNSFGNYSVSGANFNDDIALFSVYIDKYNSYPQKIILAVEPWDLNKNRSSDAWKYIENDFWAGLEKVKNINEIHDYNLIRMIDLLKFSINKGKALISISYFKEALKHYLKNSINSSEEIPLPVNFEYNKKDKILPDGTLLRSYVLNNLSKGETDKNAKEYINRKDIFELKSFSELNNDDIINFEDFINYLKKNKVEIILYFPPYHPIVHDYIVKTNKYKNVIEAEKYFLSIAVKENIKTIGAYNPNICGVDENDFFDGMHLKDSGFEKVFKNKF